LIPLVACFSQQTRIAVTISFRLGVRRTYYTAAAVSIRFGPCLRT
jgi:hypothetical protein